MADSRWVRLLVPGRFVYDFTGIDSGIPRSLGAISRSGDESISLLRVKSWDQPQSPRAEGHRNARNFVDISDKAEIATSSRPPPAAALQPAA